MNIANIILSVAIILIFIIAGKFIIRQMQSNIDSYVKQISNQYDDLNNDLLMFKQKFKYLSKKLVNEQNYYLEAKKYFDKNFANLKLKRKQNLKSDLNNKEIALNAYLKRHYELFNDELGQYIKQEIIAYFYNLDIDYDKTNTIIFNSIKQIH